MPENDSPRRQPEWHKPVAVWDATEEEIAAAMERKKTARSLALNLAADNWYDMGPKDRLTHVSEVLADLASGQQPDAIQHLIDLLPDEVVQQLVNSASKRRNGQTP